MKIRKLKKVREQNEFNYENSDAIELLREASKLVEIATEKLEKKRN